MLPLQLACSVPSAPPLGDQDYPRSAQLHCDHVAANPQSCCAADLVVEVVVQAQHAVLVVWVCIADILEQLDLVQALVKVVLVVLQSTGQSADQH